MAAVKIKWSTLLHLTELEFIPEAPKVLTISDELLQTISWLTAATGSDRRLLRCDENGALLVADPWSLLAVVENDSLYPVSGTPDTFTATKPNKGVLIATAGSFCKLTIKRVSGGADEIIYLPVGWLYWYPHKVYSIVGTVVPDPNGTAVWLGITAFN